MFQACDLVTTSYFVVYYFIIYVQPFIIKTVLSMSLSLHFSHTCITISSSVHKEHLLSFSLVVSKSPIENTVTLSSHSNYINQYNVISNSLVLDSSMTLGISFKSLDYLTVCITTQFCTTHFFDLMRKFHISGFLPAIRMSIFAILFPLTNSCTGILLQYIVSLPFLPSLPHSHSGAPFAVLTGLLMTSSQNLP